MDDFEAALDELFLARASDFEARRKLLLARLAGAQQRSPVRSLAVPTTK